MELDPHLAYSFKSRGERRVWDDRAAAKVAADLGFTDQTLLSLSVVSVVPGRRRTGCHGSLRRLWSSWYASSSAPLSTPWPRATPSASSRRSTQRARRSEGRLAITVNHPTANPPLQKPQCSSMLPPLLSPHFCAPSRLISPNCLELHIGLHLVSFLC